MSWQNPDLKDDPYRVSDDIEPVDDGYWEQVEAREKETEELLTAINDEKERLVAYYADNPLEANCKTPHYLVPGDRWQQIYQQHLKGECICEQEYQQRLLQSEEREVKQQQHFDKLIGF